MFVCGYVCQIPLDWLYSQFRSAQRGCWELNSCPLQEQYGFLTTASSPTPVSFIGATWVNIDTKDVNAFWRKTFTVCEKHSKSHVRSRTEAKPDRLEKPHFSRVMVNIERKVGRTLNCSDLFYLVREEGVYKCDWTKQPRARKQWEGHLSLN